MHGAAYNSGFREVISEARPPSECPAHLNVETGSIRVNPRDFMRIDYAQPVQNWLKECRSSYEKAVRAYPDVRAYRDRDQWDECVGAAFVFTRPTESRHANIGNRSFSTTRAS